MPGRLVEAVILLGLLGAAAPMGAHEPLAPSDGAEGAAPASGLRRFVSLPSFLKPNADPERFKADFERAQESFRAEQYAAAARAFRSLAKRAKGKSQEEDCLFFQAQSEYLAGRHAAAQDTYAKLLTNHPTTRHLPQAIQRTYDIAYAWLEDARLMGQGQPPKRNAFSRAINFTDPSRPRLDTTGRALKAIEVIQQYDPLGPLTDDAVMMAAAYKFSRGRYIEAAYLYEQLIADQPKSEHAVRAMILGSQSYLLAYQGPNYEAKDLDDASRLMKQALARGNQLSEQQRSLLERDLRTIHGELAKREFQVAQEYQRLGKPEAARYYLAQVRKDYPDTGWAERASESLAQLEDAKPRSGLLTASFWDSAGRTPPAAPTSKPAQTRPGFWARLFGSPDAAESEGSSSNVTHQTLSNRPAEAPK